MTGLCAVCRGRSREILQTQSLALLGRDAPCAIDFCACRDCGHIQQWPPVSPDLMAHHYQTFAAYELFGDPALLRGAAPSRHAARFLSLARGVGLAPGRVFEIGCASGEMLNQFRKQGWSVHGCDPSPSAIEQAKRIFGLDAALGDEEAALAGQNNLDLVLMCHVLEHLYDPASTLARIHDALAPDGMLMLEVPCATAIQLLPPGWFTFEHLHYYQPAILERLLGDAGFAVVEMRIAMRAEHYPVIAVAARKTSHRDGVVKTAVQDALDFGRAYAARDAALWAKTEARLQQLEGPVLVWGAGIHTAQILDRTGLGRHTGIAAITDRDAKKWGQTLGGIAVVSPCEMLAQGGDLPIVISSYVSERAIQKNLLDAGVTSARIVPIYAQA